MSVNIGMVLESNFPPDIRVEKEVKALLKAGVSVHVLCFYEPDRPEYENKDGLHIHRAVKYDSSLAKTLHIVKSIVTFVNSAWLKQIKKFVRENEITHLHVHDLPLVGTAVQVKKEMPNLKVVADLHENYPAAVREWGRTDRGIKALFSKYVNSYERWLAHERVILDKTDHVIAVVDEMKDRILKNSPISESKVTVVSNQEDRDFLDKAEFVPEIIDKYASQFNILYIGGFGPHRGLEVAIEGMKYLTEHPIRLLLVGKGRPVFEQKLHDIAKNNNVEATVDFLPWQPAAHVPSYVSSASICIIPHNSNEHTDNTIPHKLFQYMILGRPIITSSCAPLARVIRECNSGLVFEAGDPKDFSEKVLELYNNPELAEEVGRNGKSATYDGPVNWTEESKKLISLYSSIL